MAELEAAIYTRLAAYGNLTALTSTRFYPVIVPQNPTYPLVTYQRTDGPREHCISEDSNAVCPTLQIDSWGKTYASAKAVATQVRAALQRWDDASALPVVLDCLLESDEDNYEPDAGVFRVSQTWEIWHRE